MNITPTSNSSVSSPVSASVAAGSVDRSAGKAPDSSAVQSDKVTISKEAQDRLNAETPVSVETPAAGGASGAASKATPAAPSGAAGAASDAPVDGQPAIKKFAYGVVGLERPTAEADAKPADEYTYGRWAAVAVTSTAIISLLV